MTSRRVVVTGAASGIASATIKPLLDNGARVVTVDPRLDDSLQDTEARPVDPGIVFSLVPNVLIPGIAGIAISETVLLTDGGCEALTQLPREFAQAPSAK